MMLSRYGTISREAVKINVNEGLTHYGLALAYLMMSAISEGERPRLDEESRVV